MRVNVQKSWKYPLLISAVRGTLYDKPVFKMRHLLTLSLVAIIVYELPAQFDYQLFRPDVQYLYENFRVESEDPFRYQSTIESPIVGMKTDARECQTLYKSFEARECLPVPSFAGYEICQSPEFTIMYMGENKYIRLQTQDPIGSSWTAGLINDIMATGRVVGIDTMSFLGLLDTVKKISFFDLAVDTVISSPVLISKNYGLVSINRFAEHGRFNGGYYWPRGPITLLGMSSPAVGLQNYTDEEVFDVRPGDVFHTYGSSASEGLEAVEITSVERTEEMVKVNYTGKKIRVRSIVRDGETVDSVSLTDISDSWYTFSEDIAMMRLQPGEAFSHSEFSDSYTVAQMFPASVCSLAGKRTSVPMYRRSDSDCYFNYEVFDGTPSYFYFPGLGNSYGEFFAGEYGERRLLYAKTSTMECGEPLPYEGIVTGLRTAVESTDFAVYPNPVNDELHLSIAGPGNFQLSIIDQLGRNLISVQEATNGTSVATSTLSGGVYYLLLRREGVIVGRKRLVVE